MALSIASVLTRLGAPLEAQTIRGVVLLPDSVTPLAAGIVVASGAGNSRSIQVLTNARGQFMMRLPQAGRYTVRVLRIGYRPTIGPDVEVATTDTARVRIVFRGDPVPLSTINVSDKETCRVGADTGLMVARIWDEARKAVLTSRLSSEDAPLVADWIEYDRMLDSSGRVVRAQHVRSSTHPTTHAFHSLPAEQLADKGYVVSDNTGTTYYAPDADVLLSDSFASTHCFHLQAAPGDEHLIGVAFSPSHNRREALDIEGVLWLDRGTAELETLDFRYTNVPDRLRLALPGGRIEFLRLSDGNWLVGRWSVRMPRVDAIDRSAGTSAHRTQAIGGIQISGGEVNRVSRHDTLVFRQTGPNIAVQVIAHDSSMQPSRARLTLEGTDYWASADTNGRIGITPVLGGRYRGRVSTPVMDSLGVPAVEREVEATNSAHVDTLALPSARDALFAACSRDSIRNGQGMLHGRVRDERARPVVGAAVTITWQINFALVVGSASTTLEHREHTLGALTDESGYWRLCGVPREQSLAVRTATDSGSDAQKVRLERDEEFASVDLILHQEVSAAAREAALLSGVPARTTASLEIDVSRLGGGVLADVSLEVVAAGKTRRVTAGPSGRALVPELEPGKVTVRAKHIGYTPGDVMAELKPGRNRIPILMSTIATPMLDTVRVVAGPRLERIGRHFEFDERARLHQATASFTEADIGLRAPVDAWQMLTNVPGVKIVDSVSVTAESTRGMKLMPDLSVRKCYLRVLVDGMEMPPLPGALAFDLRRLPKPNEIHGIEIFDGPSSLPVQYSGARDDTWCGTILVWTR